MTTHQEALEAALIAEAEEVGPLTVQDIQRVFASHDLTLAPADNGLVDSLREPLWEPAEQRGGELVLVTEIARKDMRAAADTITAQAAEIAELLQRIDFYVKGQVAMVEEIEREHKVNVTLTALIEQIKVDRDCALIREGNEKHRAKIAHQNMNAEINARECAESRLSALEALLDKAVWQPIETAPKRRLVLLAFDHHPVTVGIFEFGTWLYAFAVTEGGDSPTHWMPLPAAPTLTAIKEARNAGN